MPSIRAKFKEKEFMETHRCPHCNALVVDRRSPLCTTCKAELPAEWILSPAQIQKLEAFDRTAQAEHQAAMSGLDEGFPDSSAELRE